MSHLEQLVLWIEVLKVLKKDIVDNQNRISFVEGRIEKCVEHMRNTL